MSSTRVRASGVGVWWVPGIRAGRVDTLGVCDGWDCSGQVVGVVRHRGGGDTAGDGADYPRDLVDPDEFMRCGDCYPGICLGVLGLDLQPMLRIRLP